MRIAFVTTGLGQGGAEVMLHKLLERLDRRMFEPAVFSLRGEETFAPVLRRLGVPVHLGGLGHGLPKLWSLRQAFSDFAPQVVQGWMYHGNVAALLARRIFSSGSDSDKPPNRPALLWGVRQSLPDLRRERRITAAVIRLGARWSGQTDAVVYNSTQGAEDHEAIGFDPSRRVIIPNGFDTAAFAPSPEARRALRSELGWPDDALLVGMVARQHPVKNHAGFLYAARTVATRVPHAHFVLAGTGVEVNNPALADALREASLGARVRLLGLRTDNARLQAALDVAVCASHAEGFPNVVGEAMCCGVPCVVTDVGDCADIVGDTGFVVPRGDTVALADAIIALLAKSPVEREALGRAARQRIVEQYSIDQVVRRYERLYETHAQRAGLCAE